MRAVSDILNDPALFATSAMAILVDKFGAECINWEQETMEIELRGLNIHPKKTLIDKISAATTVLSTEIAHEDVTVFNNIVQVFNFDNVNPQAFIPASLEDILWGCAEMRLLEGPEDYDSAGFSPDIADYVGKVLVQQGVTTPPSIVKFADISENMIMNRDDNLGADSLMFEAYWAEQRDIVQDMEDFVIKRTDALLDQLASLPLKNMDNKFVENIKDIMKKTAGQAPLTLGTGENKGPKLKTVSKGDTRQTVAAKPLAAGTDLGKITTERGIITPRGEAYVVDDLKETAKSITQAVPGNSRVFTDESGDPRLFTTQPVQPSQPITTDLRRQSVIPPNIGMLAKRIREMKELSSSASPSQRVL